jgi:ubiquinone/menaquinone biosynthesis C-methylase UbiE
MSKELFRRVLQCNHCNSGNLNFSKAIFKCRLKPEGEISCKKCETTMPFVNGVLIAGKANWTKNQKRNAYVYSDFWERSDKAIKYQRVTHEDELLDTLRKEFKEGVLMDAGCGSGRHLRHWIQDNVKANSFVMVDISDSIFQCRKYYEEINCTKPVIFIQSSISNMPIKGQTISSTWTSGVVGLLEDQKSAVREICRVSNNTFHLGVLTEKTIVGKLYITANLVKPFLNKVKNMKLLFMLSGLMARGAILMLKLLHFLKLPLAFIRKEHLKNIINDPNAISRLQHSLYDPIIIPKIIKYPDLKYIEWAEKYGFILKAQKTEIICDYFHFYKK